MPDPRHYAFHQNRECEYFPCHKTDDIENFNCMFCYCPLYMLEDECGGNFCRTPNGVKDCTYCMVPHSPGGYEYVNEQLSIYIEGIKAEYHRKRKEQIALGLIDPDDE